VGRIYQQTFIDTYTKVAFAKVDDRKNAWVPADMLNDRVLPFFEEQQIPLLRVLTDRGTEFCGGREHHEYELYLALEDIDHSPGPKPDIPRPMASANVSIALFRKRSTVWLFERKSMKAWSSYRWTWMPVAIATTTIGHIPVSMAMAAHPCKLLWTPYL
jgi:hypothetical protein